MYAIVRKGNGEYYTSAVFAYFNMSGDDWDYNHRYWVVLDENKKRLVIHPVRAEKDITPLILAVDSDQSNWNLSDDNCQFVHSFPGKMLYEMIENDSVPKNILEKCIGMDHSMFYDEYPYVLTEKNALDLDWVFGGFHDSHITQIKEMDDTLYVYFEGMWGCHLEVWFEGDVSYDMSSRDPENYDPYWSDGKVILQDGYVYLIDDEYASAENAREGWCWFKARKMKYHVIPY